LSSRKVLILSIALNALLILFIAGRKTYYANLPVKNDNEIRIAERVRTLRMIPVSKEDTVFIGNSLIAELPTRNKNFGVHGAKSGHVLELVNHARDAKRIYVMIGINDIVNGSVDTLKGNVRKIMEHRNIVFQSLLPVSMEYEKHNETIREYNQWLKAECSKRGIEFIDLYPHFLRDGKLNDELSIDGLHLNVQGYLLWTKNL
jgi:lysophospholipase L1-like esterase